MSNDKKPNILLIMADQLTPFLTGAYGHKGVKTPNLDKLAAEGIRFDSAYSPCPVCAPARAALMTGKYVSTNKCYDNGAPYSSDEPTIAHYLTNADYQTVLSGKMHFIGPDQLHGFSKRTMTEIYPSSFEWTLSSVPREEPVKHVFDVPIADKYVTAGVRKWSMQFDHDEETHFRAKEFLYSKKAGEEGRSFWDKQRDKDDRPFFLCASYTHPHEPFHVTKELWDLYEGQEIELPELPENIKQTYSIMDKWLNLFSGIDEVDLMKPENLYNLRRAYYALVTYIDNKVGELVKVLEDTGLRDNTIIMFTSDHGDMLGEKGMVQKRTFYEWSSRVPLIINYPDGRYAGKRIKDHVSLIDVSATILEMAGVNNNLPIDGQSVVGLIEGTDTTDREVYSELHTEGVYSTCFMLRKGKFKLIYIHGKESQLFDLESDPGEWNNLSGIPEYRNVEDDLKGRILSKFDPDSIEADIVASLLKRDIVNQAMVLNKTHWDYCPISDGTRQYVRTDLIQLDSIPEKNEK